jgi:hypothetical protein
MVISNLGNFLKILSQHFRSMNKVDHGFAAIKSNSLSSFCRVEKEASLLKTFEVIIIFLVHLFYASNRGILWIPNV